MDIGETLHVATRAEWRTWLLDHYQTKKDIWLVFYRKHTGLPRVSYDDAVEEALCFGWIDSIVKRLDGDRFAQRFSPRRRRSGYSQTNKERLRRLIRSDQVMSDVLESLADVDLESFDWPADIMDSLQANQAAWENFQTYSEPYKRIRIAYIESARDRPEQFQKRLDNLLRKTEQNVQFGNDIQAYY